MGFAVSGAVGFGIASGSVMGFCKGSFIALALSCSSHFKMSTCPRKNLPTSSFAFRQSVLSFSTPSEVSLNTDRYLTAGTLALGLAAGSAPGAMAVCALLACQATAHTSAKLAETA
jgi:hypothetical protein